MLSADCVTLFSETSSSDRKRVRVYAIVSGRPHFLNSIGVHHFLLCQSDQMISCHLYYTCGMTKLFEPKEYLQSDEAMLPGQTI